MASRATSIGRPWLGTLLARKVPWIRTACPAAWARVRVPGLKRAWTTQPRYAGDPDPLPATVPASCKAVSAVTEHCVAGIDPHKRSGTLAVLSSTGALLACEPFDMTTDGMAVLLNVLAGTGAVVDRIGVEGSSGLGLPVVAALRDSGYDVREVQASRTNDRRRRRHRTKTDITDAQAIACPDHRAPDPRARDPRRSRPAPGPQAPRMILRMHGRCWEVLRARRESLVP